MKTRNFRKPQKIFTHLDSDGKIRMVDISSKKHTSRTARAEVLVKIPPQSLKLIVKNGSIIMSDKKGDALACAKSAAIIAAKKTSELIPLTHQINLSWVDIGFRFNKEGILISSCVKTDYATGVEMEALVAVAVAALTLYDMLKAISHNITITNLRLIEKTGGKSDYHKAKLK